jgi:exodeoxyribonuclease V alpha subunit
VTSSVREFLSHGLLAPLDVELTETLADLAGEAEPAVRLAVAFASRAVGDGHACVDLAELSRRSFVDADGGPVAVELPDEATLLDSVRESPLVDATERIGGEFRPFVLDAHGRLYLRRYYEYEARLSKALRQRTRSAAAADDAETWRPVLARLFPEGEKRAELQRRAAELAARSRLVVISGGPGTGKTYTVSKILLTMLEAAFARGVTPAVALLAPTGKAAQRLGDSIKSHLGTLATSDAVKSFPLEPMTIHRALGFQMATPTRFRHGVENPLPADLVVVDEASMVDLALMTKLVEAVRPDARLILVGDKDQLASVEAGAILAEVYAAKGKIAESVVELLDVHRFEDDGGILELARAVNAGDADAALACLERRPNVRLEPLAEQEDVLRALRPRVLEGFSGLFSGAPVERLAVLDRFRVLAAHVKGPLGVKTLNDWIEGELRRSGRLEGRSAFYDGRPVIVTANDYQAELFNGDVGVVAPRSDSDAQPAVYFRGRVPGTHRALSPSRLPEHDTAYALSVHKSQGSEFGEVLLVLPTRPSPILTRELVYTAITRARRAVTIYGSPEVLRSAIEKRIARASGLRDRLAAE